MATVKTEYLHPLANVKRLPGRPKGPAMSCIGAPGEPCDRPAEFKGMCMKHYQRMRRGATTGARAKRESGTGVHLTGFMADPVHAQAIENYAESLGISTYAVLAKVVAEWYATSGKKYGPPPVDPRITALRANMAKQQEELAKQQKELERLTLALGADKINK